MKKRKYYLILLSVFLNMSACAHKYFDKENKITKREREFYNLGYKEAEKKQSGKEEIMYNRAYQSFNLEDLTVKEKVIYDHGYNDGATANSCNY